MKRTVANQVEQSHELPEDWSPLFVATVSPPKKQFFRRNLDELCGSAVSFFTILYRRDAQYAETRRETRNAARITIVPKDPQKNGNSYPISKRHAHRLGFRGSPRVSLVPQLFDLALLLPES